MKPSNCCDKITHSIWLFWILNLYLLKMCVQLFFYNWKLNKCWVKNTRVDRFNQIQCIVLKHLAGYFKYQSIYHQERINTLKVNQQILQLSNVSILVHVSVCVCESVMRYNAIQWHSIFLYQSVAGNFQFLHCDMFINRIFNSITH